MSKGKVYLIPHVLDENGFAALPANLKEILLTINEYVVETPKVARKLFLGLDLKDHMNASNMTVLNKKTSVMEWMDMLQPCLEGKNIGILSDAGCPAIADPGADVVKLAHEMDIQVTPLLGPSSILMALMGSGLNGQSFSFVGYIPIKQPERNKAIRKLEQRSKDNNETILFIETPYRNKQMMEDLTKTLHPDTFLSVSAGLTGPNEYVKTKSAKNWKGNLPEINKIPAVFSILAK